MLAAPIFIDVFRRLASTGLADREVELVSVLSLDWKGTSANILFEGGQPTDAAPLTLDFARLLDAPAPAGSARLEFITPTLLKDHGTELRVPTFGALMRRLRDRVSLLCFVWEGTEWQADYRAIGDLAEGATLVVQDGGWNVHERHSTRTRRTMPVEGFRGCVAYDSVHPDLWPLLRIGQELHVGQHVVWGNGHYRVMPPAAGTGLRDIKVAPC
jgi:hypothetical protein